VVLATAGLITLLTFSGCKAAEVFTTPFTEGYPCTSSPFAVVNCPALLVVKSPERVYSCEPLELFVTKKPFPDRAIFDAVSVGLRLPSVKLEFVAATETPDPVWTGSPLPFVVLDAEKMSLKLTLWSL